MREHPIEVNKDTEAWSLNGDLFYRKEDKKPFLGAVQAVEQQEKSLIVVGDEGVLDHYCRMLISRIKDNEQFHLEVFLSTSKDGLLKRFNQMLANLSIDEARKPASADTSVHLLVVNDASAVKDEEWTLLIRLIRDFPGANVRVALFVDKSSLSEFENRFEKLGRRVHRWTVHAPTLDEVKKLREIGKLKGYTSEVNKMLLIAGLEAEEKDKTEPILKEEVIPESLPCRNYADNARIWSLTIDAIDVGANLRDVLVENDVNVYQNVARFVNCNGKQLCGTCIVEVKDGMKYTNRKTVDEDGTLTLQKCPKNYRLACVTYVYGNVTVATIPPREGGYFGSSSSGSAW